MSHHDISVLIAFLRHDAVLNDWNSRSFSCSETHGDHREAHLMRALCLGQNLVWIVEAFAVAHQHDGFVTLRLVESEKIRRLADRAGKRASSLPHDRRIEILQKKIERAVVHRKRRQDVTAPGEREQREPVAGREIPQPVDLLLHRLEPARFFIRREHGQRGIESEHDVDALLFDDVLLDAPARTGDGKTEKQSRQSRA